MSTSHHPPRRPGLARCCGAFALALAALPACLDLNTGPLVFACDAGVCRADGGVVAPLDAGGLDGGEDADAGLADAGAADAGPGDSGVDAGRDAGGDPTLDAGGLVATAVPAALLCDGPTFVTRPRPAGPLPDDLDGGLFAPTTYVWDTDAGRVLAEAARGYAPAFTPGRVGFGRNDHPHVRDKDFV